MESAQHEAPAYRLIRAIGGVGTQYTLCAVVFFVALFVTATLWAAAPPEIDRPAALTLLAVLLPLTAHISVRVRRHTRLYFTNASILLIVTLLSPVLAAAVMLVSMGTKELMICRRCQNTLWQVAGHTGRWTFIALCASFLVHLSNIIATGMLVGGFLWICDVLTVPLTLPGWSSLPTLYRNLIKASALDELTQYATGSLLIPVLLLQNQSPVILMLSLLAFPVWLFLYFLMQSEHVRYSGQ